MGLGALFGFGVDKNADKKKQAPIPLAPPPSSIAAPAPPPPLAAQNPIGKAILAAQKQRRKVGGLAGTVAQTSLATAAPVSAPKSLIGY